MHDPLIITTAILGLLAALINGAIRKFKWQQEPELSAFFEILLSAILISVAIKVTRLALSLPTAQVSDEEKVYFCMGSLALIWVSTATIIRKFNKA